MSKYYANKKNNIKRYTNRDYWENISYYQNFLKKFANSNNKERNYISEKIKEFTKIIEELSQENGQIDIFEDNRSKVLYDRYLADKKKIENIDICIEKNIVTIISNWFSQDTSETRKIKSRYSEQLEKLAFQISVHFSFFLNSILLQFEEQLSEKCIKNINILHDDIDVANNLQEILKIIKSDYFYDIMNEIESATNDNPEIFNDMIKLGLLLSSCKSPDSYYGPFNIFYFDNMNTFNELVKKYIKEEPVDLNPENLINYVPSEQINAFYFHKKHLFEEDWGEIEEEEKIHNQKIKDFLNSYYLNDKDKFYLSDLLKVCFTPNEFIDFYKKKGNLKINSILSDRLFSLYAASVEIIAASICNLDYDNFIEQSDLLYRSDNIIEEIKKIKEEKTNYSDEVNVVKYFNDISDQYIELINGYSLKKNRHLTRKIKKISELNALNNQLLNKAKKIEQKLGYNYKDILDNKIIFNNSDLENDLVKDFLSIRNDNQEERLKKEIENEQYHLQAIQDSAPPVLNMRNSDIANKIKNKLIKNILKNQLDINEIFPKFCYKLNLPVNKRDKRRWLNEIGINKIFKNIYENTGENLSDLFISLSNKSSENIEKDEKEGRNYFRIWLDSNVFGTGSSVWESGKIFTDKYINNQPGLGKFIINNFLLNKINEKMIATLRERKILIKNGKLIPGVINIPKNLSFNWNSFFSYIEKNELKSDSESLLSFPYQVADNKHEIYSHFQLKEAHPNLNYKNDHEIKFYEILNKYNFPGEQIKNFINEINIPSEYMIKPIDLNINGFRFNIAAKTDPVNIIGGKILNCCFIINGAAKTSLLDAFNNPYANFLNIFDIESGTLIGQSWLRIAISPDKKNVLFLDNIETAKRYKNSSKLFSAVLDFAKSIKTLYNFGFVALGCENSDLKFNSNKKISARHYDFIGSNSTTYSDLSNGAWKIASSNRGLRWYFNS